MKPLIVSLVFFLISFVLFSTCSNDSNPVITLTEINENAALEKKKNKWPEVIYDSTYGEIVMDYSVITPTAAPCGFKQTYGWGFDHYEPQANKTLGILSATGSGPDLWAEYRTKWGFTQIQLETIAYGALGGFSNNNVMIPLPNYSLYQSIILTEDSPTYYVDEPIETGRFSVDQLVQVASFINIHRPSSKLYMATWQYNPYLGPRYEYIEVINQTNNTFVMCDQYDGDQRNLWSGFRNYVGIRNPSNWIHTRRDPTTEYSQLIGHANNLGIASLWLFVGSDGIAANVPTFSDKSWRNGWLRKFEQYFRIQWRCTLQDPCDCDPTDPDAGWYIYQIWPTGSFREVFP